MELENFEKVLLSAKQLQDSSDILLRGNAELLRRSAFLLRENEECIKRSEKYIQDSKRQLQAVERLCLKNQQRIWLSYLLNHQDL